MREEKIPDLEDIRQDINTWKSKSFLRNLTGHEWLFTVKAAVDIKRVLEKKVLSLIINIFIYSIISTYPIHPSSYIRQIISNR